MRICDLTEEQIHIGMRVKAIKSHRIGTIVSHDDPPSDSYWWILWDGDEKPFSGFWWNDCECEVIND
jgi:hypothetical protein